MSSSPAGLILGNLRRWKESGQPRRWVEAHHGNWNHADWLQLLESLKNSEFGLLDPAAVGTLLEELKREHNNLVRCEGSDAGQRWLEAHRDHWSHADWVALVERLRTSEYWPLDLETLGTTLEAQRLHRQNLRRWLDSGQPVRWVEARGGVWN